MLRGASTVIEIYRTNRYEIRQPYLKPEFLFEFSHGATKQRIAVVRVLTSNMSTSPKYNLVVQRIITGSLPPTKTEHVAIGVPDHDDRERLYARFVILHLIPNPKI